MRCAKCGAENERPYFEAVLPPVSPVPRPGLTGAELTVPSNCYARWACEHCGRYHFRDGTLYSNPYATWDTPNPSPFFPASDVAIPD